ncbi:conserved hypothetical protein [Ferroglobus placidus DSM 10642]|uniref:CDAN1-interacting nuclease 1 n=1 Tax=Ferroglobus placidus (strain DSM 10642 / AEDII12DO) TaxID=589924 RepID=D3S125_FERPA|nr:TPD domain-containing protein [Ferroglobus placidus]ADC64261.1 conserved hypothetical protein [Ferroglobus placidus DSM 10642]
MKVEDYVKIRNELKRIEDLNKVVRRYGIRRGTAFSILVQKKVSYVRKNYYKFERRAEEILEYWETNKSFPSWLKLPPVMKLRLLFKAMGMSKKRIAKVLKNPEELSEFEDLIYDAMYRDYVYSPVAAENLAARGKIGEKIVERYLIARGVDFISEKEIRGDKTPDFLIQSELKIGGRKVRWIESKSMFGDVFAYEDNLKQFEKYSSEFGEGAVIFWHGFLDVLRDKEFLIISDIGHPSGEKRFLKDMVVKISDEGEFSWKGGEEMRSGKFVRELIRFFKSCSTSIAAEEKMAVKKALEKFGYVVTA